MPRSTHPITDALAGLTADQRADYKAQAIRSWPGLAGKSWTLNRSGFVWVVTILAVPTFERGLLRIRLGLTRDGVAVPWNDDGWLEIRNPPILVDDPAGDIVRTWVDLDGVTQTRRLSENVLLALGAAILDALAI